MLRTHRKHFPRSPQAPYGKRISSLLLVFTLVFLLAACSDAQLSPQDAELVGRWAYEHDPETEAIRFQKNGKARYEGKQYRFQCDGEYIILSAADGSLLKLRYQMDEKGMLLYRSSEYQREEEQPGLVGFWSCPGQNWSYQFTSRGTFMEDGVFTGYYSVDENASTFTLMYTGGFDNTTCYFERDGNRMTVEYPWQMVKMK